LKSDADFGDHQADGASYPAAATDDYGETDDHTHIWDDGVVTREATCTGKGVMTYTCTECPETKTEEIPMLGHHFETTASHEATCGVAGYEEQTCTGCSQKKTVKTAEPTGKHDFATTKETNKTCQNVYEKIETCKTCGYQRITRGKVKGAHKYGAYVTKKAATVLSTGAKTRTCSVCKAKDTATIPKLDGTISVNVKSIPLKVGQSTSAVKVTYSKGDGISSWKSSNTKIAAVTKNGKITAKKAGTATITVTLKSGKKATVTVKVQKTAVATTKITLNKTKVTLKKGKSFQLKATLAPLTSVQKVTYKTSNKKVATVSSKGKITAKAKGTATITVMSGKKSVKCKVTVK
jgi:hypothetical protein